MFTRRHETESTCSTYVQPVGNVVMVAKPRVHEQNAGHRHFRRAVPAPAVQFYIRRPRVIHRRHCSAVSNIAVE
jgi:hypothetical protein